jgi:hypothetical protein
MTWHGMAGGEGRGIMATYTSDVLNDEVATTAVLQISASKLLWELS